MAKRWSSVDEIAGNLGINPDTINKWITRKSMPAHKLGRLWKFLASEVDQWVKDGSAAPPGNVEVDRPLARRRQQTYETTKCFEICGPREGVLNGLVADADLNCPI